MAKLKSILTPILSILLGILFLLSGWTKGIDPYGVSLSVTEYLRWMDLTSLFPYATPFAVLLCTFELTIGLLLISATFERLVSLALLLFMLLFTTITGILAFNPYSGIVSCGCFGEAFPLSPYATFWKNVVITLLVILYFSIIWKRKRGDEHKGGAILMRKLVDIETKSRGNNLGDIQGKFSSRLSKKPLREALRLVVAIAIALSIPLYSLINLPPLDFLHYNIDTDLREREDFRLFDDEYDEVTNDFLSESDGYRFIAIFQSEPSEEELANLSEISDCSIIAAGAKFTSLLPTSTHYYADALLLKSLLRGERGVILLKASKIVGKWSVRGAGKICSDDPRRLEKRAKRGVTLYFLLYALILATFSSTRFSPNLSYLRNQE